MTAQADPYVRVYYGIFDDPKFATIIDDKAALGWWLTLLIGADAMYPAPATLPHGISKAKLQLLVDAELVDVLPGSRYRVHGLAAERTKRHEHAVAAGKKRAEGAPREGGRFTSGSDQQVTSKPPAGAGQRWSSGSPALTSTPILSDPILSEATPIRSDPAPAGAARNGSKTETDEERLARYRSLRDDPSRSADMRSAADDEVKRLERTAMVN